MSTLASRQLESERLKRQWWWFEAMHSEHAKNPKAWTWEMLRRAKAYGRFYELARAIPLPPTPTRPAPGALRAAVKGIFAPIAIYHERIRALAQGLPLGPLDPARHWPELFLSDDSCDPALSWVELSPSSRNLIQSRDAILLRQDKPVTQFPLCVCRVILRREAGGRESACALEGNDQARDLKLVRARQTLNPAVVGKHPEFSVLPLGLKQLAYAVILFDTRTGEAAAERLGKWNADRPRVSDATSDVDWCQQFFRDMTSFDPQYEAADARKQYRAVVPSRCQYQAQAWIPMDADSTFDDLKAGFNTILKPRERRR